MEELEDAPKTAPGFRAKGPIDATFVMLKTGNTNFRFSGVDVCTRLITNNVDGVVQDIAKLASLPDRTRGYVLFAVFPVSPTESARTAQMKLRINRIAAEPVRFVSGSFVSRHASWGIEWYLAEVGSG